MQLWSRELGSDLAAVGELKSKMPAAETDYRDLSDTELEAKLVAIHTVTLKAAGIKEKYDATLKADDRDRDRFKGSSVRADAG
jgi:hypothetical protein